MTGDTQTGGTRRCGSAQKGVAGGYPCQTKRPVVGTVLRWYRLNRCNSPFLVTAFPVIITLTPELAGAAFLHPPCQAQELFTLSAWGVSSFQRCGSRLRFSSRTQSRLIQVVFWAVCPTLFLAPGFRVRWFLLSHCPVTKCLFGWFMAFTCSWFQSQLRASATKCPQACHVSAQPTHTRQSPTLWPPRPPSPQPRCRAVNNPGRVTPGSLWGHPGDRGHCEVPQCPGQEDPMLGTEGSRETPGTGGESRRDDDRGHTGDRAMAGRTGQLGWSWGLSLAWKAPAQCERWRRLFPELILV